MSPALTLVMMTVVYCYAHELYADNCSLNITDSTEVASWSGVQLTEIFAHVWFLNAIRYLDEFLQHDLILLMQQHRKGNGLPFQ